MESEVLANSSLFALLSGETRALVADKLRPVSFKAGARLFNAGAPSETLYLIDKGRVRLVAANGTSLATLSSGSEVGEGDLLQGIPYSASAEAITLVSAYALAAADLGALIARQPAIGLACALATGVPVASLQNYLIEQRLRPIVSLAPLPRQALAALAAKLNLGQTARGDLLFAAGDPSEALYIIEDGEISLLPAEGSGAVSTLADGDLLGELDLLAGRPHNQTARANADTLYWILSAVDLQALAADFPALPANLAQGKQASLSTDERRRAMDRLRAVPIFATLSNDALAALAGRMLLQHVTRGQVIFSPGDPADALHLVDTGEVELSASQKGKPSSRVGPGSYFGETALVTSKARTAGARALRDTNLWTLYRTDFESLLGAYPALNIALSQAMSTRLAEPGTSTAGLATEVVNQPQPVPAVASPKPASGGKPVMSSRPLRGAPVARMGLADWYSSLSLGAKLRLAGVILLILWLLGIALPATIISSLRGASAAGANNIAGAVSDEAARAIALSLDTEDLQPAAAEPAPTWTPLPTAMSQVAPTQPPAPTAVPPAATLEPTVAPTAVPTQAPTQPPAPTAASRSIALNKVPTAAPVVVAQAAAPKAAAAQPAAPVQQAAPRPTQPPPPPTQPPKPAVAFSLKSVRRLTACENLGKHNIFLQVVDRGGNPVDGVSLLLQPSGGGQVLDKKVSGSKGPGKAEFDMWKNATYQVVVDGGSSDAATGLTSGYPDEQNCGSSPGGNTLFHNSLEVIFVRN